jgi:hypothetical protein
MLWIRMITVRQFGLKKRCMIGSKLRNEGGDTEIFERAGATCFEHEVSWAKKIRLRFGEFFHGRLTVV